MICATPLLPLPARAVAGHLMIELVPSVHALRRGASTRNWEKFWVVPEESERTAMVIAVLGRVTPGLSAAIAGSFHFVILAVEDARDDRRRQLQRLAEAGQVVRNRDRGDQDREVEHRLALEVRRLLGGDRRVRARVVDDPRGQVRASLARAAAAVVDGHAGLDRLEGRDGRLLVDELERRSAPVERAAEGRARLRMRCSSRELLPPLAGVDEELDEEHAARDRAVATAAAPTVATRCLRPSGISGTPYRFYMVPRPLRAAPTAGQRANRGVPVQSAGANGTRGQTHGGQMWARRLSSGVQDRQPPHGEASLVASRRWTGPYGHGDRAAQSAPRHERPCVRARVGKASRSPT